MTDYFAHLDDKPAIVADNPAFETSANALSFMTAGNALFTLESMKTKARFTYRIQYPSKEGVMDRTADIQFVSVLCGPENTRDYRYLGYIKRGIYYHGNAKAKISRDAPSAKAFEWAYASLLKGFIPPQLNIYHEGRCGRCNRTLTVPESIKSGFGPECAGRMQSAY